MTTSMLYFALMAFILPLSVEAKSSTVSDDALYRTSYAEGDDEDRGVGERDSESFLEADATNGKVSVNEVSLTRDVDAGGEGAERRWWCILRSCADDQTGERAFLRRRHSSDGSCTPRRSSISTTSSTHARVGRPFATSG